MAALGTAAQSPSECTRGIPATAKVSSTRTRPRSSSGSPSAAATGLAATPAVQTSVRASIRRPSASVAPSASAEASAAPVRISMPRRSSVRAAERASVSGVCDRIRGAGSTSTKRGLDVAQAAVPAQRPGHELLELRERLHAGEARAGEDERQPALRLLGRRVGELDLAQDVVAQPDRVRQVLQREGVLRQALDGGHPGDGAERDDRSR